MTDQPNGPTGTWRMIWHDEFPGSSLNRDKWETPDWKVQGVAHTLPRNVRVYSGILALDLATPDEGALVRSKGFEFLPGMVVEFRARFPGNDNGDAIFNWPCVWTSGPYAGGVTKSGEHDIAEGLAPGLKVCYWDQARTLTSTRPPGDWNNAFRSYTLYRGKESAVVWWNGQEVATYDTNDDGGPEALLISVGATRGEIPVLGRASRLRVGHVRVWQR